MQCDEDDDVAGTSTSTSSG